MLDTVKINHVQHISFTQSRLTDAVSVILSELLSYEHPSNRGGHFLCFRYVVCLCLLRGQDDDLSLVNGVGVHKTVGVALEDGLVLHQIKIYRSCISLPLRYSTSISKICTAFPAWAISSSTNCSLG